MQYLYTLEVGKKHRTKGTTPQYRLMLAMKQGHKIHKALEKELHETVILTQTTSPEDIWGLKFLNILFGLHELQLHGMTVCPDISELIVARVSRIRVRVESPCRRYYRPNRL
jgi:hypothetical protein